MRRWLAVGLIAICASAAGPTAEPANAADNGVDLWGCTDLTSEANHPFGVGRGSLKPIVDRMPWPEETKRRYRRTVGTWRKGACVEDIEAGLNAVRPFYRWFKALDGDWPKAFADGEWRSTTTRAVKGFQRSNGPDDGLGGNIGAVTGVAGSPTVGHLAVACSNLLAVFKVHNACAA
jgi:hypothetical protein